MRGPSPPLVADSYALARGPSPFDARRGLRPWALALGAALALHGLVLRAPTDAPALPQRAPAVVQVVQARPIAGHQQAHSSFHTRQERLSHALVSTTTPSPQSVPTPQPLTPPSSAASRAQTARTANMAPAQDAPTVNTTDLLSALTQAPTQAAARAEPVPSEPADEGEPSIASSLDAAALRQLPVYTTQNPGAFTLPLQTRRLSPPGLVAEQRPVATGSGELRFDRDDQGAYALSLSLQMESRPVMDLRSRGRLGSAGLAPERFTDSRRGRSANAANFDPVTRLARFSARAAEVPLAAAAQDRLSWLVQLPAVVRADPSLLRPGAVVWLQVVGARGGWQIWRFEAMERQTVTLPDGRVLSGAWRWLRRAEQPYDLQVEAWLSDPQDPAPALARLTPLPGGAALEFWPSAPHSRP